tara:strand:+ start:2415 stop:2825 length:411 start_codon:yes stop_codon:yes gene_type:complete
LDSIKVLSKSYHFFKKKSTKYYCLIDNYIYKRYFLSGEKFINSTKEGTRMTSRRLVHTVRAQAVGTDSSVRYRFRFKNGQQVTVNDGVRRHGTYYGGQTGKVVGFTPDSVVVEMGGTQSEPESSRVDFAPDEIIAA